MEEEKEKRRELTPAWLSAVFSIIAFIAVIYGSYDESKVDTAVYKADKEAQAALYKSEQKAQDDKIDGITSLLNRLDARLDKDALTWGSINTKLGGLQKFLDYAASDMKDYENRLRKLERKR